MAQQISGRSLRVLLVDDSEFSREVYQQMLRTDELYKFDVMVAENARDALKAVRAGYFDCVLLDMHLPDGKGIDFINAFHTVDARLPIVILTADNSEERALLSLQSGADDYLMKEQTNHLLLRRTITHAIERRKVLMQFGQLQSTLERERILNKKQRDFISLVSHEFRTPMAIISGASQMLLKRLPPEGREQVKSQTQRIEQAMQRLTGLLDNALNFLQLEEGRVECLTREFDMRELLERCIKRKQQLFSLHKFHASLEEAPQTFSGDPILCDQIFANLLSNAAKYSHAGSDIYVRVKSTKKKLQITVEDKGIGMDADTLKQAGQKFFRGNNTIGASGTGVGLYLSQEYARLQDASLKLESQPGKGTKATVIFQQR